MPTTANGIDLYDPAMDKTVKRILQRREQRELEKRQASQCKVLEQKDKNEKLLELTPRVTLKRRRPASKTKNTTGTDDDSLAHLDEEDEITLDWTEAEIQALRNQVLQWKRVLHPPPTPPPTMLPPHSHPHPQSLFTESSTSPVTPLHSHHTRPSTSTSTSLPTTPGTPSTPITTTTSRHVRTHTGTTIQNDRQSEKRKRWQSIARSLAGEDGWYGRNYRACRWVWRVVKKRQAKIDARQARDDQERLKKKVPETMEAAKFAHNAIFTTGGGDVERAWTEEQLRQLNKLEKEHTNKMFRGDKRARWKRIQAEMGLPDRSYKSCQRAYRAVNKLQQASKEALDLFDQMRKEYAQAKVVYSVNIEYLNNCEAKLEAAAKLIPFQTHLDTQLRNVARIADGELDNIGRPDEVALLLERGADPNAADRGGYSALMAAARNNACGSVEMLLNYGADINAKDSDGTTAIMHAIEGGGAQAVQLLLRQRALLKPEEAGDIRAPGVWAVKIEKELHEFVEKEQGVVANSVADRRWFRQFERQWQQQETKSCTKGGKRGGGVRKGKLHGLTKTKTTTTTLLVPKGGAWPPAVPGSRGSTAGSGTSFGLPPRSSGSGGGGSLSGNGGLPALLQAPSALEALRLGLEGSRQRKDRMKRESKEKERMDKVAAGGGARPPTHERTMMSNRRRADEVVVEVAMDRERQRSDLRRLIATKLHRACTAGVMLKEQVGNHDDDKLAQAARRREKRLATKVVDKWQEL